MENSASHASFLPAVLIFCAAAVVAVPLFRRLGQSAVMGYLAAGVAIGPAGLSLIRDPGTVRGVAELGVVLFLFIIGLELKIPHLMRMRRDIFGAGLLQLTTGAAAIGIGAVLAAGQSGAAGAALGLALALSATSVALQMLEERGDLPAPYGQRAFAILLFQDLSIVPILALLPVLARAAGLEPAGAGAKSLGDTAAASGLAIAALTGLVLVGRYGLNPFFALLARSGAREVLTASALLVVLGAALLMEVVGISMAMGAFIAGVLLAESNFRHQLEADIEPFRGILLGLFFMSVGMSIDAGVVARHWGSLVAATAAIVVGKSVLVAGILRATGSPWRDALRAAPLLSPAGEFAFVLLPLAAELRLLTGEGAQFAIAVAALTMLLGPLATKAVDLALVRWAGRRPQPLPEPDDFADASGRVLVIGFGRFGQTVNQVLLAQGVDVTVIDKDVDSIRSAARFGFRIYYGDGTRLDVLRAAGAERARIVCVCVEDRATATKIVELVHAQFPQARTHVRAYDRIHAIELMRAEADGIVREMFDSALAFGRAALEELGVEPAAAAEVAQDVRKRDLVRLHMQKEQGLMGGSDLLHGAAVKPEPLIAPRAKPRALSPETRGLIDEADRDG